MMKDKALEDLFLTQRPVFDDKDEFMEQLAHRLDAVEYLHQYEEANLRRYKYALAVAFVMGVIAGGIMLAFVLTIPNKTPLITFNATSGILLAIEQNSRLIASTALMLLLAFGIMSIINNILDIAQMKVDLKSRSACL